MKYLLAFSFCAGGALADPIAVHEAADRLFDGMPRVEVVESLESHCGHRGDAQGGAVYCTSDSAIYLPHGFHGAPGAVYEMAHVLGHAVQVRHGVADVALREIRQRPQEEEALRGMVTRQVECVAGVILAEAGQPRPDLLSIYGQEPMTGSHWGRNPLRVGPRVSIGTAARQAWLDRGYAARDVAVCAVGEMGARLLIDAQREAN